MDLCGGPARDWDTGESPSAFPRAPVCSASTFSTPSSGTVERPRRFAQGHSDGGGVGAGPKPRATPSPSAPLSLGHPLSLGLGGDPPTPGKTPRLGRGQRMAAPYHSRKRKALSHSLTPRDLDQVMVPAPPALLAPPWLFPSAALSAATPAPPRPQAWKGTPAWPERRGTRLLWEADPIRLEGE